MNADESSLHIPFNHWVPRSAVKSADKLQLIHTVAPVLLFVAPSTVLLHMFPAFFSARPLYIVLATAGFGTITVPIYFKLSRHLVKRYAEPPTRG